MFEKAFTTNFHQFKFISSIQYSRIFSQFRKPTGSFFTFLIMYSLDHLSRARCGHFRLLRTLIFFVISSAEEFEMTFDRLLVQIGILRKNLRFFVIVIRIIGARSL